MLERHLITEDESQTVAVGRSLSVAIGGERKTTCLYLYGDLGAGKTTFSRGLVAGFGHNGNVKSPTYTLVEPYELPQKSIYHFDLYRLASAQELEFLGIDDYISSGDAVLLFEWADKGAGFIPEADIIVTITEMSVSSYADSANRRSIALLAKTEQGETILSRLKSDSHG